LGSLIIVGVVVKSLVKLLLLLLGCWSGLVLLLLGLLLLILLLSWGGLLVLLSLLVGVGSLMELSPVLTVFWVSSATITLLWDGVVLGLRVVLWGWGSIRRWGGWNSGWSLGQMIPTHLETILAGGVVDDDLLTVRVNIGVLSLPFSVLSSLLLELDTVLLDVGRAETTVSGKISGLCKDCSVLGVDPVTLG